MYRVPRRKAEAFVHALRPIMKLFEEARALSDELLRPKDMVAKFGGNSIPKAMALADDEELWIEIAKFKDANHMEEVHSVVAKNSNLDKLPLALRSSNIWKASLPCRIRIHPNRS